MEANAAGHNTHDGVSANHEPALRGGNNRLAARAWLTGAGVLLIALSSAAQVQPAAAEQTPVAAEKVLELSRFLVTEAKDAGYRATDTLAGTQIRTNLNDIGSSLSIVTKQFLEDAGVRGTEDLLVYTLGTEVGGTSGNFGGAGNGVVLTERNSVIAPDSLTRVRGLAGADNTRDLFLTDIPWDNYNVDRIELQRGPNSILFGLGSPGGVMNASTKQARFKDSSKVEARVGSYGSYRAALDLNRVLIKNSLAVRLNLLGDWANYQQKPAFKDDKRLAAALRFDPTFLNKAGAHTSLRVSYEGGEIEANNPRSLPPMDRLTPWFEKGTTVVNGKTFNNLDQFTGDFRYSGAFFPDVPGSGFLQTTSPNYRPGIQDANNGNYAFLEMQFPGSGMPVGPYYVPRTNFTEGFGLRANGTIDGNIQGLFNNNKLNMVATTSELAVKLGIPFANAYRNKAITDPSIFDFYNKLIDGPNKPESRNFNATNITLSQTFWQGRLGIEGAYDRQDYRDINDAIFYGLGTGDAAITVDVNTHLPDQTPNPNVGRPMIVQRTMNGGFGRTRAREVENLKAYLELDAADFIHKPWLARLLGRHVLTGALSVNDYQQQTDSWTSAAVTTNGFGTVANDPLNIRRELALFTYLGPDMRGRSSPAGLNLSNIQNQITYGPNRIVFFDSHWNRPTDPSVSGYVNPGAAWTNPFNGQILTQSENPANYVGWTSAPTDTLSLGNGDRDELTFQASKTRSNVKSKYFVWQGFFWDGMVVPMFGYREDTARAFSILAPVFQPSGLVDRSSPGFDFKATPDAEITGVTKSYSLVIHTPKSIQKKMPAGLAVSLLYNKSSNFQPLAGRTDILGKAIGNPSGTTEEYGVVASLLSNRLRLKASRYETALKDSSYQPQRMWRLMTADKIAWVKAKQYEAGLTGDPAYAGAQYNYGSVIGGVFTQSAAQRAQQSQDVQAVLSKFDPKLWAAWGVEATEQMWKLDDQLAVAIPPGMNGTVDSLSKGYEFELDFQPVAGWNIAINAARADAVRSNVGGDTLNAMLANRDEQWNGPAGRLLRSGTGIATMTEFWNDFYGDATLDKLLEGSSAPEIRRWRLNIINNYRFQKGRLKGVNLGGAYRWQDRVVIGYPSVYVTLEGLQRESFDIKNPYYGPTEEAVDLWVGYTRKFRNQYGWKIQLNVRDVLSRDHLVPINTQPDGTPAAFRIQNGATWFLTNSLEF